LISAISTRPQCPITILIHSCSFRESNTGIQVTEKGSTMPPIILYLLSQKECSKEILPKSNPRQPIGNPEASLNSIFTTLSSSYSVNMLAECYQKVPSKSTSCETLHRDSECNDPPTLLLPGGRAGLAVSKVEKRLQNLKELTTLSSFWTIVFPYIFP